MIDRSHYPVAKKSLHDRAEDDELVSGTPEERVAMMWELFQNSIPFMSKEDQVVAQSRLSRHVVRVVRRGS